jgi:O-antigen ligase
MSLNFTRALERFFGVGVALITLLVVTGSVTDPVNAPKFLTLGAVAFGAATLLILGNGLSHKDLKNPFFTLSLLFVCAIIFAAAFSESSLTQNLYGVYGRNTGLLTYFFLSLIGMVGFSLGKYGRLKGLLLALFVSGLANVIYCLWVVLFGDFIGWENPYKSILGTFGNPNFISSFLAIFGCALLPLIFSSNFGWNIRVGLATLFPLVVFLIWKSDSLQGFLVLSVGVSLALIIAVRERSKNFIPTTVLTLGVSVSGVLGVLGVLQYGPLQNLLYQPTVSYRGQYWLAAINMAKEFPLHGVGMDAFGDWYLRMREPQSLITPGIGVITNTAHSVPLDLLAYGGFPLLISYVGLNLLVIIRAIRVLAKSRKPNPIFVSLFIAWICYQAQSIASINQIGLAVWGWAISGALVGFFYFKQLEHTGTELVKGASKQRTGIINPSLILALGTSVGLLLSTPPYSADSKWVNFLRTHDKLAFEKSLSGDYFAPLDISRMSLGVNALIESNLPNEALTLAVKMTEFNPQSIQAWKSKLNAEVNLGRNNPNTLQKISELDPLDPKWKEMLNK